MKIKKTNLNRLVLSFIFMFSFNVSAEVDPFKVIETMSSKIRLSKDGTGIVKDVHCYGCDFNMLKITTASKASKGDDDVSIFEVRGLKDVMVTVSFDPNTREVQYIRW